ncbi:glutamine amidase [Nitzschia inconspicua]|uniref:Protein N-terminal glutamine amidohydrolase n=1 Tax=Nitzschia inconspicua TaxID=303405 RepID=A0A9K3M595_9STRA|nr:glutamine amidase [Nitzschia inconspicua]
MNHQQELDAGLKNAESDESREGTMKPILENLLKSNPSAAQSALDAPTDVSLRVPCYCEENVWRLAFRKLYQQQYDTALSNLQFFVVFVSNPKACVPMFHQLASTNRNKPIFWDYHVILVSTGTVRNDGDDTARPSSLVWDMDSHLSCPCPFQEYIDAVFWDYHKWPHEYTPHFRVVDAMSFLRHFSSDRSHMLQSDGTWNATPPPYDCILQQQPPLELSATTANGVNQSSNDGNGGRNTLLQYMTISKEEVTGSTVLSNVEKGGIFCNQNERVAVRVGESATDQSSTCTFGEIYTLPQLRERFQ